MLGLRFDPYGAYNFLVEIDGIIVAGFTDVSGLSINTEVETIQEGGVNDYEHKLPKGSKYTDITLKRGLTDFFLYEWYREIVSGKINRKSGAILLLDHERMPVMGWRFFEAYPVRWDGPTFNAATNTVASETLVLTFHRLV
jgi:phage tail-like protein